MMFKLVVCNAATMTSTKDSLKRARDASENRMKTFWSTKLPGDWLVTAFLAQDKGKFFNFLKWRGSNSNYTIFRLTENTELVVTQVDIDIKNIIWQEINTSYKELEKLMKDPECYSSSKIDHTRSYQLKIYRNYLTLLNPVMDKII